MFMTEVFFVSTREHPGVKFGGPIGDVRDPETGLGIGTMVYGDFSIRVTEPEKLVVGLVGMGRSSNEDFLGWFKSQVLKVTRDRIAELLVKKRWPLLDVTSGAYTEEIETEVIAGVKPHVDTYGLTVVRLGNFHVSIKEEDEATLKKFSKDAAYSRMAGGFQQYAQGQAMLGASEGMAKGGGGGSDGALSGMGMGMGMGMAQMFMNQNQQQQRQAPPRSRPSPRRLRRHAHPRAAPEGAAGAAGGGRALGRGVQRQARGADEAAVTHRGGTRRVRVLGGLPLEERWGLWCFDRGPRMGSEPQRRVRHAPAQRLRCLNGTKVALARRRVLALRAAGAAGLRRLRVPDAPSGRAAAEAEPGDDRPHRAARRRGLRPRAASPGAASPGCALLQRLQARRRRACSTVRGRQLLRPRGRGHRRAARRPCEEAWKQRKLGRGASTITQQLAKNLWLSTDRSLLRKAKELILAHRLEEALPKNRILTLYLNVVEWGNGVYGIEAGAREHFGVSAAQPLASAQGAILAAMLPAPRKRSPKSGSRALKKRRPLDHRSDAGAQAAVRRAGLSGARGDRSAPRRERGRGAERAGGLLMASARASSAYCVQTA